jgi:site-specific recombinase XerD
VGATLQDSRIEPEGWVIQVHGKGARDRIAALAEQTLDALQTYFGRCGVRLMAFNVAAVTLNDTAAETIDTMIAVTLVVLTYANVTKSLVATFFYRSGRFMLKILLVEDHKWVSIALTELLNELPNAKII